MRNKSRNKKKVLITGAAGFVGEAIKTELSKKNLDLILLNRTESGAKEGKTKNISEFVADITKEKDLERLAVSESIEFLIHSAGLAHQFGKVPDSKFEEVNVKGTKNVLELAKRSGVRHFIFISSVAVYGASSVENGLNEFGKETFECKPQGAYAKSKLKAEQVCREFCLENNIKLTVLRLSTVVGENDRGNFYRLIQAIDKRKFVWIGKGKNRKSIVYKGDVARACLKLIQNENVNELQIFNISAKPIKVKKIVQVISEVLDKDLILKFSIPPNYLKLILENLLKLFKSGKLLKVLGTLEKWLAEDIYPAGKFEKEYDFKFKTSPEHAICLEVLWYKNQKC